MGRYCSGCNLYKEASDYSTSQWRKGDGISRCSTCVTGNTYCNVCGRTFRYQHELDMHMQTHRARNVACPVCGDVRFTSGANATQHVESGYCPGCPGCPGRDNARRQIYDYAKQHQVMRPFLTDAPRLTYGGYHNKNEVPDFPYQCPSCNKCFRQMSELLQHQDNKHGINMGLRRIGY